jgi:hypothetical protein
MCWAAAVGTIVSAGISYAGSQNQASATQSAAGIQQQAALGQESLASNVFNAQAGLNAPTRAAGGLAQSREAYLLGLSPNLNISQDFQIPNISVDPTTGTSSLSWTGPGASAPGGIYGSNYDPSTGTYGAYPVGSGPNNSPRTGPIQARDNFQLPAGGMNGRGTAYDPNGPAAGFNATNTGVSTGGPVGPGGAPNPNAGVPGLPGYGSFASPYSPSTFYQDPGYQFIQQQGNTALNNRLAASGMSLSGGGLQAALQYNTGLASQEFNNAYNRSINTQTTQLNELNALASGGQIATGSVTNAAGAFGASGATALANYGNAGAAGTIGAGNAFSSGLNSIANYANYFGQNGGFGFGNGGNPNNLGGSFPQAPAGSTTTYDASGNITGSTPNIPT